MKTVKFYGASDDLVEIEGIKGEDEFYFHPTCESEKGIGLSQAFLVGSGAGGLKVYAIYDGCWHFSIGPIDEDIEMPQWPIRYSLYESGYSVLLEIDVPDNAFVKELKTK